MPYPISAVRSKNANWARYKYWVSTTGNDATGDGSIGKPWLTVNKALTTVPSAGGFNVGIVAGEYAEGAYLSIARSFTNTVNFIGIGGVKIHGNGTNSSYSVWISGTTANITFANIDFTASYIPSRAELFIRANNCHDINFVNCIIAGTLEISPLSNSTYTNIGFSRCRFAGGQTLTANGTTSNINNLSFNSCVFTNSLTAVNAGGTGMTVNGCVISNAGVSYSLIIGVDGDTGNPMTGVVVTNNTITGSNHALIIGAGVNGATVSGNTIAGTAHYGVILKECANITLTNNTVSSTGDQSVIRFKAATSCVVTGNILTSATLYGVHVTDGDTGHHSGNIAFTNNTVYASGNGNRLFYWPVNDAGYVCDYNRYRVTNPATWGLVLTTTVTSLATLQAAWAGYNASNDSHSTIF